MFGCMNTGTMIVNVTGKCRQHAVSEEFSRRLMPFYFVDHESSKSFCSWFIQTEWSTSHSSLSSPLPDELSSLATATTATTTTTTTTTPTMAPIGPAGRGDTSVWAFVFRITVKTRATTHMYDPKRYALDHQKRRYDALNLVHMDIEPRDLSNTASPGSTLLGSRDSGGGGRICPYPLQPVAYADIGVDVYALISLIYKIKTGDLEVDPCGTPVSTSLFQINLCWLW